MNRSFVDNIGWKMNASYFGFVYTAVDYKKKSTFFMTTAIL
jgi:hypothetical protein